MKLFAATSNKGKLEEFQRILNPLGIEIVSPSDLNISADVEETGETFAQNARLKAFALYSLSGLPTFADDSGLCVNALGGRPGVYSARYQGENSSYPQKISALVDELEGSEDRSAQFVCSICCVIDKDTVITSEGTCKGKIGYAPIGGNGFGYDPIFMIEDRSFAEFSSEEKDIISHRGKALREFAAIIVKYLDKPDF